MSKLWVGIHIQNSSYAQGNLALGSISIETVHGLHVLPQRGRSAMDRQFTARTPHRPYPTTTRRKGSRTRRDVFKVLKVGPKTLQKFLAASLAEIEPSFEMFDSQ